MQKSLIGSDLLFHFGEKYRAEMEKFYFDETKYDTYLEQLGVDYPEIKDD